jgi:sugar/nucleoside kinase (ribokinase family)
MFSAAGERAGAFCEAVRRLGERAEPLGEGLPADLQLLHLEAAALLGAADAAALRKTLDAARRQGALVSIDLGPAGWIRDHGSSRIAYQLATIQPDILFAAQDSAEELGAPLEGVAVVPVLMLGSEGCSVYGRRLASPITGDVDPGRFMAAFCVAFVEGAAPVEAAGRAILVGALSPR